MLILKKKIIFINIKKKFAVFTQAKFLYYFIKNKFIVLVYLSNYLLKKMKLINKNLIFLYNLK